MLKNDKGITLTSLVITIIILLILASVATVSGMGAIDYIKFNNAKAQFQTMQSQVNAWYEQSKNNADVLNYGVKVTDTSCDQEKAGVTATAVGGELTGYRYFKSDYIKDELDIDGISYDFLINISSHTVLLYGGITYQDKTYYSAEDFGINVIKSEDLSGNIIFYTSVEDGKIIIYNIEFPNGVEISKYSIQYQLPGTTNWVTLTSDKGNKNVSVYNDAWVIETTVTGTYKVRIITSNEKIKSEEKDVNVTSE